MTTTLYLSPCHTLVTMCSHAPLRQHPPQHHHCWTTKTRRFLCLTLTQPMCLQLKRRSPLILMRRTKEGNIQIYAINHSIMLSTLTCRHRLLLKCKCLSYNEEEQNRQYSLEFCCLVFFITTIEGNFVKLRN